MLCNDYYAINLYFYIFLYYVSNFFLEKLYWTKSKLLNTFQRKLNRILMNWKEIMKAKN